MDPKTPPGGTGRVQWNDWDGDNVVVGGCFSTHPVDQRLKCMLRCSCTDGNGFPPLTQTVRIIALLCGLLQYQDDRGDIVERAAYY